MVRWLIKADGMLVGTEYDSEKKAWRKARQYEAECADQDTPCYPLMTVESEEIE